jgi:GABA(A) receptor-associated protein
MSLFTKSLFSEESTVQPIKPLYESDPNVPVVEEKGDPNSMFEFKQTHSFAKRCEESARIRSKYPDRIPIICEVRPADRKRLVLDKKKYLVPTDLTMSQFMYVIRKRIKLEAQEAMFMFVDNKLAPLAMTLKEIYQSSRDTDGFVYVTTSLDVTFGMFP